MNTTNAAIRQFLQNAQNDPEFLMAQIDDSIAFNDHVKALISRIDQDPDDAHARIFPNPDMLREILVDRMNQSDDCDIYRSFNPAYVMGACNILAILLYEHYPDLEEHQMDAMVLALQIDLTKIVRDAYGEADKMHLWDQARQLIDGS